MKIANLSQSEYGIYYKRYIDKLAETTGLKESFKAGKISVLHFFKSIPKEKLNYRYEAGKWSIKEVFQHLIDTERIFMYRCFRIARNDKTALAGFNQNIYIEPSNAKNKTIDSLLNEFTTCRDNAISLLNSLTNTDLKQMGTASDSAVSARAIAFINLGHYIWHINIIKERYL